VTLVFHGLLRQIAADIAFGSKSDIAAGRRYVRLSLKKQTYIGAIPMSALYQKQTSAPALAITNPSQSGYLCCH
jgi:hypothetical protein